jgi:hypothetical protein
MNDPGSIDAVGPFPDRGPVILPGCAARAGSKATLEKGPSER